MLLFPQYNVETLEKSERVHVSNIVVGGAGAEQVYMNSRVTVCPKTFVHDC